MNTTSQKITPELIQNAITQLAEDNKKITVQSIRQHLGKGSPNLIAPVLKAWRESRPKSVEAGIVMPESIALAVCSFIATEVNKAKAKALEEMQEALDDGQEFEQHAKALEESQEAQAKELEALKAQLQAMQQSHAQALEAEQAAHAQTFADHTKALEKVMDLEAKAQKQEAELKAELSRAAKFETLAQQATEQAQKSQAQAEKLAEALEVERTRAQSAQNNLIKAETQAQANAQRAEDFKAMVTELKAELQKLREAPTPAAVPWTVANASGGNWIGSAPTQAKDGNSQN
ncbi:DNA-binding protein [Limnobacter sp.]|uniref:DNA-binding protein n=1 Tax=Limnobacter sp. TaxID=2003368 RepID=UPI0027B8D8FC|nr:DNA-binding protein [Limnobacter sp.]